MPLLVNQSNVDKFRARLAVRPHAATLGGQPFLDTDYQQFLLFVDPYDPSEHHAFRQLPTGDGYAGDETP